MPTGWTEVTIGAESMRAYVQDTAGPVEVHAPPGTKATPGTPARIRETRYVVRAVRDPGDRGEVTIIELMTEAEAKAAREATGATEAPQRTIAEGKPGRAVKAAPRRAARTRPRATP